MATGMATNKKNVFNDNDSVSHTHLLMKTVVRFPHPVVLALVGSTVVKFKKENKIGNEIFYCLLFTSDAAALCLNLVQ